MNVTPALRFVEGSWKFWVSAELSETGKRRQQWVAKGTPEQREAHSKGLAVYPTPDQLKLFADALNASQERQASIPANDSIARLVERWLNDSKGINPARKDIAVARQYAESFSAACGSLPCADLRNADLDAWFAANPGWKSAKTRNNALTIVRQIYGYACDKERGNILAADQNPLNGRKQEKAPTTKLYTAEETDHVIVRSTGSAEFVEIWNFIALIGCRPDEACRLESSMIQRRKDGTYYAELVEHKNARHNKKRIMEFSISTELEQLVLNQLAKNPSGRLFKTATGKAWTPENLESTLRRLDVDSRCTMYTLRHASITSMAKNPKVSLSTVAALHGTSVKMILANYLHEDTHSARSEMVKQLRG